jgi:hypothetical protein
LPSGVPLVPAKYDGESIVAGASLTACRGFAAAIWPADVLALAKVAAHATTLPDAPVKALRAFMRDLCADHFAIVEAVEAAATAVEDDGGEPIDGKKYPGVLVYATAGGE